MQGNYSISVFIKSKSKACWRLLRESCRWKCLLQSRKRDDIGERSHQHQFHFRFYTLPWSTFRFSCQPHVLKLSQTILWKKNYSFFRSHTVTRMLAELLMPKMSHEKYQRICKEIVEFSIKHRICCLVRTLFSGPDTRVMYSYLIGL